MQKETSPEEFVGANSLLLDCEKDSDVWQGLLSQAEPYVPQENQPLSFVLPVPEQNVSMVFYQDTHYYYPKQTFTTLKIYEKAHNFLDYSVLTKVLRRFNCFGHYRMPMVSFTSVLGIPDTPFARSLSQRPKLQKFPLPLRLLKEAYEKELALQTILRFGYQSGLEHWNHQTFYDLFDQ